MDTGIVQKQIPENLSAKYTDSDFNYHVDYQESKSILGQFLDWFFNLLGESLGFELSPDTREVITYIVLGLCVCLAAYFILRFILNEKSSSVFTKKAKALSPLNLVDEHIENFDFQKHIQEALALGNYRLAIRFQYLEVLKICSGKEYIDWHFDKTNSDYIREIENPELKESFQLVSGIYEYAWYGKVNFTEENYLEKNKMFNRINQILKQ